MTSRFIDMISPHTVVKTVSQDGLVGAECHPSAGHLSSGDGQYIESESNGSDNTITTSAARGEKDTSLRYRSLIG